MNKPTTWAIYYYPQKTREEVYLQGFSQYDLLLNDLLSFISITGAGKD